MAKDFKVGALVWAKMKGYPPWPGEIIDPPLMKSSKSKKPHHYVLFFGSNNYAWIPDENILEHNQNLVEESKRKIQKGSFQKAVETIIEKSEAMLSERHQTDSEGAASPKFKEPDNHSLVDTSMDSSGSNKDVKKKTSGKKEQESVKKRSLSPEQSESESISLAEKAARYEDIYRELLDNMPPDFEIPLSEIFPPKPDFPPERTYVERPATPPIDLLKENPVLEAKNIKPTPKKIGFIGLGRMGKGIVKNLSQSGHSVIIWNRTIAKCKPFAEKLNIEVAATPEDIVIAADIIFCCVSDDQAVKQIVFGNWGVVKGLKAYPGMKKGYVEMTTMDANSNQDIADKIKLLGCRYLEAPIKGSRNEANEGTLFIQTAGDRSLYDDCKSCFQAICERHTYLGAEVGYATKIHLVHNMFMGTLYASTAESIRLALRARLDEKDLLEILKKSVLQDDKLIEKGRCMVEKDYETHKALKYVQREMALGLKLSSSVEQPTPVCAAANELYKQVKTIGYGDHDVSAVFEGTI